MKIGPDGPEKGPQGMKSYTGPFGERVTANDQAGQEFIDAYARHAAAGLEQSACGMAMLANIVDAAGGVVRVPFGGLGRFGRRLTLTAWRDLETMDLVLETSVENAPPSQPSE